MKSVAVGAHCALGAEDVRPQVVNGHFAMRQSLDGPAVTSGDTQPVGGPLGHKGGMDSEMLSQGALASGCGNRGLDGVHGRSLGCLSAKGNSRAKCADERRRLASLGMAAPVSKDPEESAAAALFADLLRQSEWTHQSLAEHLGVSPGRVSQWATNRGAIPADRAIEVAEALSTRPELVSPAWGRLKDQFLASQSAGLDAAMLGVALTSMDRVIRNRGLRMEGNLGRYAPVLALAYAAAAIEFPDGMPSPDSRAGKAALVSFDRKVSEMLEGAGGSVGTIEDEGTAAGGSTGAGSSAPKGKKAAARRR